MFLLYHINFLILKLLYSIFFASLLLFTACSKDEDTSELVNLSSYLGKNQDFEITNELIACAAGDFEKNTPLETEVSLFFYPLDGAYDFHCFETESTDDQKDDYDNYEQKPYDLIDVFGGYLKKFLVKETGSEKWAIVTYKREGKIHICNPVRYKHYSKPSEFNNNLLAVSSNDTGPLFEWGNGREEDNAIFFQVISDENNDLITGTYTYDKFFQYYDTSNVVLNITSPDADTELQSGSPYNFTLMGVSEDNWVNLVCTNTFNAQ